MVRWQCCHACITKWKTLFCFPVDGGWLQYRNIFFVVEVRWRHLESAACLT